MTTKLTMYTYENGVTDSVTIEVPTNWLVRIINEHEEMELHDFLDSYTCDTIDWLYKLAVEEQQIINA